MKSTFRVAIFFLLLRTWSATGQDPGFIQFYTNALYTNPALTGTAAFKEGAAGRVVTNYRNQWDGSFRTFCLGWDQPFDFAHGAFGAQYINNASAHGLLTTSHLNLAYAARFSLGENLELRAGIQGGMMNRSLDWNKLKFGDQLDSSILRAGAGTTPSSVSFPNFGTGLLIHGKNVYLGIAIHNLLEPNQSFYKNPNEILSRRITIHGGYRFAMDENTGVAPQFLYMQQKNFTQLLFGTLADYKNILAGIWYRQTFGQYHNSDAVAFNIGYTLSHFRLNYSYDISISDGRSAIPHSHEISLGFRWKTKQKIPLFNPLIN